MDRRSSFVAGVRAVLPATTGIVPFGLIVGAATVAAGLTTVDALGFSVVVFAGASQLAAIDLLTDGAALPVIVVTMLVINLRMVMYSASLASYFEGLPLVTRLPVAYVLTDYAYGLSVTRFEDDGAVARLWYYLGAALPIWVAWQLATVAGAVAGARVPESIPLEFVVPLVFIALLMPAIESRAAAGAAVVGGGVALAAATLPFNLGLMAGAVAGILAGVAVDRGGSVGG
jgi:predicted branched-subunit amino acid permease